MKKPQPWILLGAFLRKVRREEGKGGEGRGGEGICTLCEHSSPAEGLSLSLLQLHPCNSKLWDQNSILVLQTKHHVVGK